MGNYAVYNIATAQSTEMTYKEVCKEFPNAALLLFNVKAVSYIIVYSGSKRVAVISRINKED